MEIETNSSMRKPLILEGARRVGKTWILKKLVYRAFKLFISDVGLLGVMVDPSAKDMLMNNSVFEEYKGVFSEQYVAQQYFSIKTDGLYYYTNENSTSKIDFIMLVNVPLYLCEEWLIAHDS